MVGSPSFLFFGSACFSLRWSLTRSNERHWGILRRMKKSMFASSPVATRRQYHSANMRSADARVPGPEVSH